MENQITVIQVRPAVDIKAALRTAEEELMLDAPQAVRIWLQRMSCKVQTYLELNRA